MKVMFSRLSLPATGTVVLLLSERPAWSDRVRRLDASMQGQLTRAVSAADFTGKRDQLVEIVAPHGTKLNRLVLVGTGAPDKLASSDVEKIGGKICGLLLAAKAEKADLLLEDAKNKSMKPSEIAALLGTGAMLRSYRFVKYKSKSEARRERLKSLTIRCKDPAAADQAFGLLDAVSQGVFLARDLVNEPANELYPAAFTRRIRQLAKLGVKVEVMGDKALKQKGFRALLGVGQGSVRETQMVVMQWSGGKKSDKPIAFIGKGVTFDTGGISIKPSAGMGDMKGDMGGAACVTGLMRALAGRKAEVNAIGIVGLVENMPSAAAQRPGDVVKSLSGQTIEVLNTDAEGRLVLADVLWYANKTYKPKFMIDLATLTGAIMVALGQEHAGLFSNDDTLSDQLAQAGHTTGEKVWRMPLSDAYDKMIDSKVADVKNIGGRYAGSITAAQFLQRFVEKTPWAHLDIAGTAMNSPKTDLNTSWGSGYGVRLLNQLVLDHYE